MIGIIDYGLGNLQAFLNVYKRLGLDATRVQEETEFDKATHLILPGVGNYDHALEKLNASGLREKLDHVVLTEKKPILGVCVGMQIMANSSEEGEAEGLGWIPGEVKHLSSLLGKTALPLPHMGWNQMRPAASSFMASADSSGQQFYFLHSFFYEPEDRAFISGSTIYGEEFSAAVSKENIHGIQCHPEKSHHWGAALLEGFARL